MKPTQSDVHVDRPLSSIVVAFMQSDTEFAARSVFPVVPVAHKTDEYWKFDRADWLRINAEERAPGTPSSGGTFSVSQDTYNCREYAIHYDLLDSVLANADSELSLDTQAARWVATQLLMKREAVFTSTYITTSVWTGTSTGSDITGVSSSPSAGQVLQWNNVDSTPIQDIRTQMTAMKKKTGYRPNVLTLGPETWDALVDHPDLLDRIKFTQKGVVTTDLLASLLGLDKIVIAGAIKNTAVEGQTASYSFMHGKYALLTYSPSAPSIMEPSAGYIFAWTKRFGAGPDGQRVKRFYMDEIEAERIEGQMNFDMKVVCSELGAYFTSVVA